MFEPLPQPWVSGEGQNDYIKLYKKTIPYSDFPKLIKEDLFDHDNIVINTSEHGPEKYMSQLIIRDIDGHRYIIDTLTNERTEIPAGYELVDFIDGLFLLQNNYHIFKLVGPKANDKNAQQVLDQIDYSIFLQGVYITSIKLFHFPFPGNDWLGLLTVRNAKGTQQPIQFLMGI